MVIMLNQKQNLQSVAAEETSEMVKDKPDKETFSATSVVTAVTGFHSYFLLASTNAKTNFKGAKSPTRISELRDANRNATTLLF
jgi:hypothetical protein